MKDIDMWIKILGWMGQRVKLKVTYSRPKIRKGEIGTVLNADYLGGKIVFLKVRFSRRRTIFCFADEVSPLARGRNFEVGKMAKTKGNSK